MEIKVYEMESDGSHDIKFGRYVRLEDVERIVKEAFIDGHFKGFLSPDGNASKDWKESYNAAQLRVMKGE